MHAHVPPAIKSAVARSVGDSKKKDMVILVLFLLSFLLFVVSLYITFAKNKKIENANESYIAEIENIETGNIDYTATEMALTENQEITLPTSDPAQATRENRNEQEQIIIDFYQAINTISMPIVYRLTDARLEESNVFKTYYNKGWLSKFSEILKEPKVVVMNIQEESNNSPNPDIKNFSYTLEYVIANKQQKFTEERSTVLIKRGDAWRIGKLMCETKGCSTMPFFNPDKYK